MPRSTLKMELGNLTCRFGSELVLLDLFDEIIYPAFTGKNQRSYDETRYFFENVKLFTLPSGELIIAGRFIKDTIIEREQVYRAGRGLVRAPEKMETAPSSIFALILDNHRLIYVKENVGSPSMESFRSTLLNFIRARHRLHIENQYKEEKKENMDIKKSDILSRAPYPTLEIIPLSSTSDIDDFLQKYSKINSIEFEFSDRNDETDNNDFFEDVQRRKDRLQSKKTVIKHTNKDGLDKEVVSAEIHEGTQQGNQVVKIIGIDQNGDTLKGNNENFQIKVPVTFQGKKPQTIAKSLAAKALKLAEDGIISLPILEDTTKRKLQRIISKHIRGDSHG